MRMGGYFYWQNCGIFMYPVCELWDRQDITYFYIFYCEYPCVSKWGLLPSVRCIHPRFSVRKRVLRNLSKFTEKYRYQGLFLITLQALACIFIKKDNLAQVFSFEFYKISTKTFLQKTVCEVCIPIVHKSEAKCL